MLGVLIDRLQNEITEKGEALRELQRQHDKLDEKLKVAQYDATQNQGVIEQLNESKAALVKQFRKGQKELQSLKDDKETFKSAVEFIVNNDSRQKDTFIKKTIHLQTKNSALQQDLNRERQAKEKQKSDFEEKTHALQAQHRAQVADMREEIRELKERIQQLEGCLPGASDLPPMVRT